MKPETLPICHCLRFFVTEGITGWQNVPIHYRPPKIPTFAFSGLPLGGLPSWHTDSQRYSKLQGKSERLVNCRYLRWFINHGTSCASASCFRTQKTLRLTISPYLQLRGSSTSRLRFAAVTGAASWLSGVVPQRNRYFPWDRHLNTAWVPEINYDRRRQSIPYKA